MYILCLSSSGTRSPMTMTAPRWVVFCPKRWHLIEFPLLTVELLLEMSLRDIGHIRGRGSFKDLNLIVVLFAHEEIIIFLCCEYRLFLLIVCYKTTTPMLLFNAVIILLLDSCLNLLLGCRCQGFLRLLLIILLSISAEWLGKSRGRGSSSCRLRTVGFGHGLRLHNFFLGNCGCSGW